MSYWPRFKLTPYEARYVTKYSSPDDNRRGVLRRFYPGFLVLNETTRLPTFAFNIARKSRVFGLSISGDVSKFRINISDATGEQYTVGQINADLLQTGNLAEVPGINIALSGTGIGLPVVAKIIPGFNNDIHIFEPNISLAPNQTLTIQGFETEPYGYGNPDPETIPNADYRIDFVLHVYEFPGMPGSPL
jgi:hypothetical protein